MKVLINYTKVCTCEVDLTEKEIEVLRKEQNNEDLWDDRVAYWDMWARIDCLCPGWEKIITICDKESGDIIFEEEK